MKLILASIVSLFLCMELTNMGIFTIYPYLSMVFFEYFIPINAYVFGCFCSITMTFTILHIFINRYMMNICTEVVESIAIFVVSVKSIKRKTKYCMMKEDELPFVFFHRDTFNCISWFHVAPFLFCEMAVAIVDSGESVL